MEDVEKLKHLIGHWSGHNEEHAKTFLEWSQKADSLGRGDVAAILRELSEKTRKLEELLKKARGLL